MSLSKLSKLPSEVLSCVLNNKAMRLENRLRLRLLCNRWCDIIEDGLKKETSLFVSLGLCLDEPDYLIIDPSDLRDEFPHPLFRLFTSLTQLKLYFQEYSLYAVSSLLAHLDTANLTTVKFYCNVYGDDSDDDDSDDDDSDDDMPYGKYAIARALTALPALTSLTLLGHGVGSALLPHLGPLISRLEKFGCTDCGNSVTLAGSLSPRCTHLWLCSKVLESFTRPFLVQLSRNLTYLELDFCDNATIWQFISQMHGLSSLTLHFFRYNLDSSIFRHLAPFSRLAQVKLYLKYGSPLALPSKKETPLSSIKRLTLDVDFGDSPVDYQAFFSAISAWFPALLHLTLITKQDTIPAIQASLSKLPFSVKIKDSA